MEISFQVEKFLACHFPFSKAFSFGCDDYGRTSFTKEVMKRFKSKMRRSILLICLPFANYPYRYCSNGRASKAKAMEVALRHPSEPEHSRRVMIMPGSKKMA